MGPGRRKSFSRSRQGLCLRRSRLQVYRLRWPEARQLHLNGCNWRRQGLASGAARGSVSSLSAATWMAAVAGKGRHADRIFAEGGAILGVGTCGTRAGFVCALVAISHWWDLRESVVRCEVEGWEMYRGRRAVARWAEPPSWCTAYIDWLAQVSWPHLQLRVVKPFESSQ